MSSDSWRNSSPPRSMAVDNLISRKKDPYPISDFLESYLRRYGRIVDSAIIYEDLLRHSNSIPMYNERGEDTLWSTVFYSNSEHEEVHDQLKRAYAILKADGDMSITKHLYIDRVDLCMYGNTLPFRVRIVNHLNDNHDYFYVKRVDANRIYGLELEHILSPNRINYFISGETIVEEHIIGIPADAFMRENRPASRFDEVRLAKEFVKFNERVFVRLLGDMHSGNFVVDITRDFEKWHYRMRPIDFDQQSHHHRKEVYLPHYFHQNGPLIEIGRKTLAPENVLQYQTEERALIANRVRVSHGRFRNLMSVMSEDIISTDDNVQRLRTQLAQHYQCDDFQYCLTMGEMVQTSINLVLAASRPATIPLKEITSAQAVKEGRV